MRNIFFWFFTHLFEYTLLFLYLSYDYFLSPDQNELSAARSFLEQAAETNLPEFLKALSDVLAHANNSNVARQAAGLQLKNHLTSKDVTIKEQYQQRWLSFPSETRDYVKKNVRHIRLFDRLLKKSIYIHYTYICI